VQYIGKIETWFSGNLLAELPKILKWKFQKTSQFQRQAQFVAATTSSFKINVY
jgi:hypothetical protein